MATPALTIDQLLVSRETTERVSQYLIKRLREHIDTLYPILAPRRILGKYVGSREPVARADEAYQQLTDKFKEVCGKPFELRSELDDEALSAVEHGIDVQPWEYSHTIGDKVLTITSPFRWVLTFKSDYSLKEMRQLLATKGDRRAASVRHFVVNALVMNLVIGKAPGAMHLLEDLRYKIGTEVPENLGKLPMVTIDSGLTSVRPPDELILSATRFSGVPAFIELIEPSAVDKLADPFRAKISSLLAG
jgi:hypothetical protein